MKNLKIEVSGINCAKCVNKINSHFSDVDGVESISVDKDTQTIDLSCEEEVSNMTIRNDLIELGFTVNSLKKI